MFSSLEVRKDIYWVGALDFDLRIFDIIMYSDYGTTYNSFIMKGSNKTVLLEVVKEKFFDEFIERLKTVCEPSDIDYVVISHTEPDHTGSLAKLLKLNPKLKVVASKTAIKFLENITNMKFDYVIAKDGDTLDIGGKTLKFLSVPFLHWPDSIYTYIPECKTLVTCDSFGCHYCDEKVFNDKIEMQEGFLDAYKYYFDCIMGPFKPYVIDAINKIKDLDIEIICNGHGPVLRKDIDKFIKLYREWATVTKNEKPKIFIGYVSSYGYTEKMAKKIEQGIKENKSVDVVMYNLLDISTADALKEISNSQGLLLGSPTLIGDTLPQIWSILSGLNSTIHKGLVVGAFGSHGWSGEAIDNIEGRFKQLKFRMPLNGLKICFNPSEEDLQKATEFGYDFSKEVVKLSAIVEQEDNKEVLV